MRPAQALAFALLAAASTSAAADPVPVTEGSAVTPDGVQLFAAFLDGGWAAEARALELGRPLAAQGAFAIGRRRWRSTPSSGRSPSPSTPSARTG